MERKEGRARALLMLRYIPAVIWMVVIFNMSGQNGTQSGSLSLEVTKQVVDVIEEFRGGDTADREKLISLLHTPVRKAAHMAEYAILALFFMFAFSGSMEGRKAVGWSVPASFLYACTDELHQRFVSDRAGQITDVGVDMLGVLAMVLLALALLALRRRFGGSRVEN